MTSSCVIQKCNNMCKALRSDLKQNPKSRSYELPLIFRQAFGVVTPVVVFLMKNRPLGNRLRLHVPWRASGCRDGVLFSMTGRLRYLSCTISYLSRHLLYDNSCTVHLMNHRCLHIARTFLCFMVVRYWSLLYTPCLLKQGPGHTTDLNFEHMFLKLSIVNTTSDKSNTRFNTPQDVLLWDIAKSRCREMCIKKSTIALKFDRHLGSSAACQISKWCHNFNYQSRSYEASRNLAIRRLIGWMLKPYPRSFQPGSSLALSGATSLSHDTRLSGDKFKISGP